jgi:hypothetical protein
MATSSIEYVSVLAAQLELGMTKVGWHEFVKETGLSLFYLPGGGHIVERAALAAAIRKSRKRVALDDISQRELPL